MSDASLILWTLIASLLTACSLFAVLVLILTPETITFEPSDSWYRSPDDPTKKEKLPSLFDAPSVDLSVVIPAYNESKRLTPMLNAAIDHLLSLSTPRRTIEFIIVDDGSTDETAAIALSAIAAKLNMQVELRVVTLAQNRGKGAAVKQGVLHSRGRRILMVDADGASQFEDLEKLWTALDSIEREEQGIAVGSRAHLVDTEAVVKRSFIRNLLMHGLHICLRTLGVGHIRDTQCGFKLFTRISARMLFPPMHIAHWIFDVELLLLAHLLRLPVAEVPIAWHEIQGSKINLISDSIAMLRDLVVLRTNYASGRWTIRGKLKTE